MVKPAGNEPIQGSRLENRNKPNLELSFYTSLETNIALDFSNT